MSVAMPGSYSRSKIPTQKKKKKREGLQRGLSFVLWIFINSEQLSLEA